MDKKLEDYTYEELRNYLAGNALMQIGSGMSFKAVVNYIMHCTNLWTTYVQKDLEKKKYGKNYKK